MIAIYSRVSTQEQANDGYSIDEQIERLTKYCEAMNWKPCKSYTDAGFSGGNTNRPALQHLIHDVKAGMISKVVVYKLDRLSRSQKDTLELIEDVFLANNVDFVSMTENFDTATPFGRAMIGILSVFAQLEREQIKERLIMGREGRAKQGKFHGGGAEPIGYDYKDGKLIINEFEAMQIRQLFDLFLSGKSYRTIEKYCIDHGFHHKHGSWQAVTIKRALQNDLYIGMITFGNKKYQGEHEPIIDADVFVKVNSLIDQKSQDYAKHRRQTSSTLLGGLLICHKCGAKYGVNTIKSHGNTYKYYMCYSRRKCNRAMITDPTCKNKSYQVSELDNIILDQIKSLSADPDHICDMTQKPDDTQNKISILQAEITKITQQKSRFLDLYGVGTFSVDDLQQKILPLEDQLEKLKSDIHDLQSQQPVLSHADASEIISSFSGILDRHNHDEIRLVIESLIDFIEIDEEHIIIHWKFS